MDFIDNSVIIANVQKEVAALRLALSSRPESIVEILLKENDKLTRYYLGFPIYDSFMHLQTTYSQKLKR